MDACRGNKKKPGRKKGSSKKKKSDGKASPRQKPGQKKKKKSDGKASPRRKPGRKKSDGKASPKQKPGQEEKKKSDRTQRPESKEKKKGHQLLLPFFQDGKLRPPRVKKIYKQIVPFRPPDEEFYNWFFDPWNAPFSDVDVDTSDDDTDTQPIPKQKVFKRLSKLKPGDDLYDGTVPPAKPRKNSSDSDSDDGERKIDLDEKNRKRRAKGKPPLPIGGKGAKRGGEKKKGKVGRSDGKEGKADDPCQKIGLLRWHFNSCYVDSVLMALFAQPNRFINRLFESSDHEALPTILQARDYIQNSDRNDYFEEIREMFIEDQDETLSNQVRMGDAIQWLVSLLRRLGIDPWVTVRRWQLNELGQVQNERKDKQYVVYIGPVPGVNTLGKILEKRREGFKHKAPIYDFVDGKVKVVGNYDAGEREEISGRDYLIFGMTRQGLASGDAVVYPDEYLNGFRLVAVVVLAYDKKKKRKQEHFTTYFLCSLNNKYYYYDDLQVAVRGKKKLLPSFSYQEMGEEVKQNGVMFFYSRPDLLI